MAHYAELDENNQVIYVVYMDNKIITDENGNEVEELGIQHLHTHHGSYRRWIRTSYGGNFRGKYACKGDIYREDIDMFISPSSNESLTSNEVNIQYNEDGSVKNILEDYVFPGEESLIDLPIPDGMCKDCY